MGLFRNVRAAIRNLNPDEVRELATRPLSIAMVTGTAEEAWRIESFLCPPDLPPAKRAAAAQKLHRVAWNAGREHPFDVEIWDRSLAVPPHAFVFDPRDPEALVRNVLRKKPDLAVPLARSFPAFRQCAIQRIVTGVAKENAMFSAATAIPDIIPFLSLPWAIGEFASDTAFLTMNQVRMVFLMAAASDREIGYSTQKKEIASVVAAAFGFRAIARQLVSKIPFGGGLIPKAAISYAGTQVVGRTVDRLLRGAAAMTEHERKTAFDQALERGKEFVGNLLAGLRASRAPSRP